MPPKVSLAQINTCLFTIAKPKSVTLNKKARIPAYLLSLQLSPELLVEHKALHKKDVYSSSAQIVNQHTPEELEGYLLLTCINFPRKQIGPKMSDCLTCGVLPLPTPGQDPEEYVHHKRDNTVCVRPSSFFSSYEYEYAIRPGAPVVVYPLKEQIRTTNPRDLTFEDFEKIEILTGTVLELHISKTDHGSDRNSEEPVPRDVLVDFGHIRGIMRARLWLLPPVVVDTKNNLLKNLVGRQIVAVTNLDAASCEGLFEEDMAAVLTVKGMTTVEPAKGVENGYRLA